MSKVWCRNGMILLAMLLGLLPVLAACGGGGGGSNGNEATTPSPTQTASPTGRPRTITIGDLTDMTGIASAGIEIVDKALADVVGYFNDEGLIPGVTLKVVPYDTSYEISRNLPGYESLIAGGADLIYTPMPSGAEPIRERANQDGVVVFTLGDTLAGLEPPGYVFCLGIVPEVEAMTFLSWIAANDWDWQANGPARVGGAGWTDNYAPTFLTTAKAYCQAHPEQFEWLGADLTDFGFSWARQVEKLKDADYVFGPTLITNFAKQYGEAGGKGKLCVTDPQLAFMSSFADAGIWPYIDGGLVLRSSRWWGEHDRLLDLTNELLEKNHPGAAVEIRNRGVGYLGASYAYLGLEAIRETVETVGAENFTTAALYDTLQSFSVTVDGLQRYSFSPTKRDSINYYRMYRMDAGTEGLVLVNDAWFPAVREP